MIIDTDMIVTLHTSKAHYDARTIAQEQSAISFSNKKSGITLVCRSLQKEYLKTVFPMI